MGPITIIERTVRVRIPDGCGLPSVSFGTEDLAVLDRVAAEHPDARHKPGEYAAWKEGDVHVQVSYVGARKRTPA